MVIFLLTAILVVLLIATGLYEPLLDIIFKAIKWVLIGLVVLATVLLIVYLYKTFNVNISASLSEFFGKVIQWGVVVLFFVGIPFVIAIPIYDFLKFLYEKFFKNKKLH